VPENRNGNDSTITRFGWKAQNKSLQLFAAEAYNVEQVRHRCFQMTGLHFCLKHRKFRNSV